MFPKRQYIRSPALMKAYRAIPCQSCGRDDGSVCGAHSNWGEHGKGRSIKADDNRCASLCSRCHTALDQGHVMSAMEKKMSWFDAHRKTWAELVNRGLWPSSVPYPEF